VLSEFAGAARGLPGALIVNPYDTDAIKRSMLLAHEMNGGEQAERMRGMRRSVRDHDIYAWAGEFLERLKPAPPRPPRAHPARNRRAAEVNPSDADARGDS
jgi:trehalose-6-phosphate synthase